eukprot:3437889-Rhodomonas_salina.2
MSIEKANKKRRQATMNKLYARVRDMSPDGSNRQLRPKTTLSSTRRLAARQDVLQRLIQRTGTGTIVQPVIEDAKTQHKRLQDQYENTWEIALPTTTNEEEVKFNALKAFTLDKTRKHWFKPTDTTPDKLWGSLMTEKNTELASNPVLKINNEQSIPLYIARRILQRMQLADSVERARTLMTQQTWGAVRRQSPQLLLRLDRQEPTEPVAQEAQEGQL